MPTPHYATARERAIELLTYYIKLAVPSADPHEIATIVDLIIQASKEES